MVLVVDRRIRENSRIAEEDIQGPKTNFEKVTGVKELLKQLEETVLVPLGVGDQITREKYKLVHNREHISPVLPQAKRGRERVSLQQLIELNSFFTLTSTPIRFFNPSFDMKPVFSFLSQT